MPTFTQEAIATKKQKKIELVGVDLYIITDKGVPQFTDGEFGPFKCEFISNRGTKVWPGFVSPDLLMVNWYRCRFMATKPIKDHEVADFLVQLSKKWEWSAAQKLWNYDGEAGYSKAY
ncbi:MAG: isocitrate dehydrogenase [Nitrospira sp.]|nr:isocitrate dehydrogenase [Nitrospira sp.]MCP9473892.1 isocitrate dehydrogenase [Nitrospira sp.]